MATLENAADELVVRLKGLDSEVEESQHTLEELRGRVDETSEGVEQEWSHLTEAVASLLEKLREEQEQLAEEAQEALQATAHASGAVQESGAQARSEIAEGQTDLEALSQHATGLEPGVESLVAEAGEAPARGLAERAKEVEEQIAQALQEACGFLRDEVVTALERLEEDTRERCQALRTELAEKGTTALGGAFDDWEAKVDALEDYVSTQAFLASHSHGRAVVDWALEACKTACETHLEGLTAIVEETVGPLEELSTEIQLTGDMLARCAAELMREMHEACAGASRAVSALDTVRDLLATYSFVGV